MIPGVLPDFEKYYLQKEQTKLQTSYQTHVDNRIWKSSIICTMVQNNDWSYENGGYWGYLKNLYINQDMMVNKMTAKNKNIKDVLYDILNELSSAVNSFWDFQIVEGRIKTET